MNLVHHPTVLSLAIGCGLTMFDLWLFQRRALSASLEDLARLRVGSRRILDYLEEANLVKVSRDAFGDVLTMTWRADPSTITRTALQLVLERFATEGLPLPNVRLKLTGLSLLKESEWLRPNGHGLSSTTVAPADLPPAA